MFNVGPVERSILRRVRKGPLCAALIDPEQFTEAGAASTAQAAERAGVELILVGGSTVADQMKVDRTVITIKKHVSHHVILFPGNITGVSPHADAIFFSSLLNSANPYFIIGAQALGSLQVFRSNLESIPMGYLVFGSASTTSLIGQTSGIPPTKKNVAVIYALAAKYLGMRTLYLEAGSGASEPLPEETIAAVRRYYDGLLLVGGGITDGRKAGHAARAGADIVVVGNLLQSDGFETHLREIVRSVRKNRT